MLLFWKTWFKYIASVFSRFSVATAPSGVIETESQSHPLERLSGDILAGFLVVLLQVRTANFLLALFGCEFYLAQSTEVAQCPFH